MGDAVRDGDVHADPEETIDAAGPRPEPGAASTLPVEVVAATRDYQELLSVERNHYVITRELARGGIGRVFEARDLRLGRQVAIKELLPKNRDAARRFEREARITARLQHPAIIHVYEAGMWPGGEPFYVMPVVAGRSLDKVVAERTTLDQRLGLLPNVIAVADALAYAHNANVIHRDLKPANVLVGEFGETVVIDWGLAKDLGAHTDPKESLQMRLRHTTPNETASGSVVGTPMYMAPEQARGDAVDQRADVYALGALLYKVLCGAAPYEGTTSREVLDQVRTTPPVPVQDREPGAPPDLVAIVAKAMARDPDDRYITASALAADLKRFEMGQLVGAHRYTIGELVRRWLQRHRVAVSISAAALVALIVLGVFSVQRVLDEKRRADVQRADAQAKRANLLEERGRTVLLEGHAGHALAYLVGAVEVSGIADARGFLIADAMRPFEARKAFVDVGPGDVVVAASADGRRLAMAGTDRIKLVAADGALVREFRAPQATRAVAFDAQSTRLAAGGDDGTARVWTLDGAQVAELRHGGRILDVAFSPDGRQLVTAGADATVRLWDIASGQQTPVECPHSKPIVAVRFSVDGKFVATAGEDARSCVFYAVTPAGTVFKDLRGHTAAINSVAWSPDDKLIVTASDDGTAIVWNADRGKPALQPLRHDEGSLVEVAAISHDGHSIVTAGSDFVARVWQLPSELPEDGTPRAAPPPKKLVGHGARIVLAAFSADDTQLVTGGFDDLVKIWDLESLSEVATFEHGDVVTSVAFVPQAALLATGSRDGAARLWNTQVSEERSDLDAAVNAIAIGGDGAVAAALADSLVRVRHRGGKTTELHGHLGGVLAVAFTGDGKLISAGEDPAAIVWDVAGGREIARLGNHGDPTLALAVDGDRVLMLVARKIEVWSLAQRKQIGELAAADGPIDAIAVNPQNGAVVGVGRDGTFAAWDRSGNVLSAARKNQDSPYTAAAFAPDGKALVTSSVGAADVWPVSGTSIGDVGVRLEGGMGIVRAIVVSADGKLVITAGDNGRAMIWDRDKGKLVGRRARHAKPISSLALAGDSLWIASEDQTLTKWNVRSETRLLGDLQAFMNEHVPVELDMGDVVRKRQR